MKAFVVNNSSLIDPNIRQARQSLIKALLLP